jgi:hypothetical protein
MEKSKIDKVIEAFRHYIQLKEEMVANAPGTSGSCGGNADATGKTSIPGFDPVMGFKMTRRRTPDLRTVPQRHKKWVNSLQNK